MKSILKRERRKEDELSNKWRTILIGGLTKLFDSKIRTIRFRERLKDPTNHARMRELHVWLGGSGQSVMRDPLGTRRTCTIPNVFSDKAVSEWTEKKCPSRFVATGGVRFTPPSPVPYADRLSHVNYCDGEHRHFLFFAHDSPFLFWSGDKFVSLNFDTASDRKWKWTLVIAKTTVGIAVQVRNIIKIPIRLILAFQAKVFPEDILPRDCDDTVQEIIPSIMAPNPLFPTSIYEKFD